MSATNGAAVHCSGVTKTFHTGETDVKALRGVDLEVRKGELMMLVGPSGCGKTTLISVIAGILDRDGGDCRVYDRDFLKLRAKEKTVYRGKTLGFVFQAYNLIPALSAVENVSVPLLLNGVSGRDARQRSEAVLERVGLKDRMKSLPSQLSGGQQQRVAIARALVHNPRLIVCDEPTSALDHETGHRVMEVFREVGLQEDRALIIVTHDQRIFEFADRIAYMDDGLITRIENSPSGTH